MKKQEKDWAMHLKERVEIELRDNKFNFSAD